MKDFSQWNELNDHHFNNRSIIAFDLDDTLTEKGRLPGTVIEALEKAQKKGWKTLMVSGRPAGWGQVIARLLPFDAVITENGAAIYYWEGGLKSKKKTQGLESLYWSPEGYTNTPQVDHSRKQKAQQALLEQFPQCKVASDQALRIYDLAIDFAEEIEPPCSFKEAEALRESFEKDHGATAKVSSIHVNGWWGDFNKGDALSYVAKELFNFSVKKDFIYVGDSPNDGPLFKIAGCSIGVANIKNFDGISDFHKPTYVTQDPESQGCLEILEALKDHNV